MRVRVPQVSWGLLGSLGWMPEAVAGDSLPLAVRGCPTAAVVLTCVDGFPPGRRRFGAGLPRPQAAVAACPSAHVGDHDVCARKYDCVAARVGNCARSQPPAGSCASVFRARGTLATHTYAPFFAHVLGSCPTRY